jgi:nicotinate-nucleotide adenylyltransferase
VRIGVLGGSFDPVHSGHLILAETAREQASLDRVIFVPTGYQWRKADREMAPGNQRCEMVRLAIAGNADFEVSTLEVEREGPSYTEVTLELLAAANPAAELVFILGQDALADLPNWHAPERVVELASLAVATRAGEGPPRPSQAFPAARLTWLEMPLIEVSASDIRERVQNGRSIRYLVPDAVRDYIASNGLYAP